MKFIAVGLLFVFLSVEVSCRVVPVRSNSTKDVDATKRSSLPSWALKNARVVAGYLQSTVPSLMTTRYKPQNGFYYMAPQTFAANDFQRNRNLWFNSKLANEVLITKTKLLPSLFDEPAWLPDSNSNLAIAGVNSEKEKKPKNNFDHSEHKLIVASPEMWDAYLKLNGDKPPPVVILGSRRDICCSYVNKEGSTYCTQDYIKHVKEMRAKYNLQDTQFMAYVHCPPKKSSEYYRYWTMSQKLLQENGIHILDPCYEWE